MCTLQNLDVKEYSFRYLTAYLNKSKMVDALIREGVVYRLK